MAKITREKLARGAKLLVSHIFTPLEAAQAQFTNTGASGFNADQLEAGYAPFRVNLSVPHLSAYTNPVYSADNKHPMHAIPFMLPPLQGDLDFVDYSHATAGANTPVGNVPNTSSTTPPVILDEVSVSFDTRCEPAAITSNWYEGDAQQGNSGNQGKLSYERINAYNLKLAIVEKKTTWAGTTAPSTIPSKIIWSGDIVASIELASPYIRTGNPYVVTDIRRAIDPYKSYTFAIIADELDEAASFIEIVSLEISMKFLSPLRLRDSGATVQNIPTRHLGERNKNNTYSVTGAGQHSTDARTLMGAKPTPGATIEANTASGVQTFMAVLDEFFRSKLRGGYNMHSEVPNLESVRESAAYTVLAVPMFNNTPYGGISLPTPAGAPVLFPYITGVGGSFIDRRYIPIVAPMTIHHVLFTWSWMPFLVPAGGGATRLVREVPEGAGAGEALRLEIGVGMGTGARADMFGYEQIARATLNSPPSATWAGTAVDLISFEGLTNFPHSGGVEYTHDLEIHSMDIEGSGQPGLNGMTAQGHPVFVGRSLAGVGGLLARQRENMQATGTDAKTLGAEQWLEVRAKVSDPSGDWGTNWKADQMIVGTGGFWVYIIGKTHLV